MLTLTAVNFLSLEHVTLTTSSSLVLLYTVSVGNFNFYILAEFFGFNNQSTAQNRRLRYSIVIDDF